MLKIGSLRLENRLVMAPMAGITSMPFRVMVKNLGAGLVTTEMVSAKGLALGNNKTGAYLRTCPEEAPLAVQIFGSVAEDMALAAQMASEAGAALIDINMGCPVRKVTKTGAGAALMKDRRAVESLVKRVRMAVCTPLTVKIRSGWAANRLSAPEIGRVIQDCGADAISIHARFATQGYSGHADWNVIGELTETLDIPVIGNGDIVTPQDALEMKKRTGCDGVMIGRAAVGNPWIFRQVLSLLEGRPVQAVTLEERRGLIMEHYRLLMADMGEYNAAKVMRGLLLRYTKGLPHSRDIRGKLSKINSLNNLIDIVDAYFLKVEQRENES